MGKRICNGVAAALFVCGCAFLSACGGNSTPVGITISPATPTVPLGKQIQFQATVTGTATTSVTWQICLPPTPTNIQPTTCSPAATGQTQLPSGYGTITSGLNNSLGGLYTAPATLPPTNGFLIVATSTVNLKTFGETTINIDSGVRVTVNPATATIAAGDHFQFTATVAGTSNTAVTWEVNGIAGGSVANGFITANGLYTAPIANPPASVTITAVSGLDPSATGTATVSINGSDAPTVTSLLPNTVGEGSLQQDVYISGSNFNSNDVVLVGSASAPIPTIFISTTLLRATLPSGPLSVAGLVPLLVQAQNGDVSQVLSGPQGLTVVPSRPAVVAVTPNTLISGGTNLGVTVVGGFFSPQTTVQCNGSAAAAALTSSQQLSVTIPGACIPSPGLYPLIVRNSDVVPPSPAMSAVNFAVEPGPGDIATGIASSFAVGTSPSAIAIDPSLNLAVVANQGDNTVSIINLATDTPVPGSPVAVGHSPTSVAIDDQITTSIGTLGDHIAAVTNSADNSVSTIDLTTLAVSTFNLPNPNTPPNPQPVPYAIGINPLTHRGLIALQATNTVVVLDFSSGQPAFVSSVGGTLTPIGTGLNPAVAIDPKLNWGIVTPGGAGSISIVDLGHNPKIGANSTDVGRAPITIASLTISTTVRGVGINSVTHQALLSDPNGPIDSPSSPSLSTFSLLDASVNPVPFTQNGVTFAPSGLNAAAVNALANIGIAVNGSANNAYVVDLQNSIVLQTITGFNAPSAVAINQAANTAFVVNQGNNTVSVVPLATTTPNPFQIVESSPNMIYAQNPPTSATLSIVGSGFTGSSQVMLDGAPVPTTLVNAQQVTAAIPASSLATARRFIVYVQNGTAISNVTDLTVIQPVTVGTAPVGVAVDPYLDQAVVTNSVSGTISVVNLLNGSLVLPQSASFFTAGTMPYGVAILPRTGQAVVANNGSNNVTVLDEKGVDGTFNSPQTLSLDGGSLPVGVGIDQDSGLVAITDTIPPNEVVPANSGGLASFTLAATGSQTGLANSTIGYLPLAVAFDPAPNNDPTQSITAVTIDSQTSALDLFNLPSTVASAVNNLQLPTGVVFDSSNQDFLLVDSTQNDVIIVNPMNAAVLGTIRTGINPTSLDYNFNSSTLVTSNASSNTLSVLDYVCPSNPNGPTNCPTPQVQDIIDVGGLTATPSIVIGPNSVALDPRLNLAVQVDQTNNRVLLVPLPH
jgi:DNA-binding beta-propeller fold protein YncE